MFRRIHISPLAVVVGLVFDSLASLLFAALSGLLMPQQLENFGIVKNAGKFAMTPGFEVLLLLGLLIITMFGG